MARIKPADFVAEKPTPAKTLENLEARIRKFCAIQVQSDGGWAPVDPADITELYDIVGGIIAARWAEDLDGDLPVSVNLTDKTRYERLLFLPVQHTHLAKSRADFDKIIENLATLTGHYAKQLETTVMIVRDIEREAARKSEAAQKREAGTANGSAAPQSGK